MPRYTQTNSRLPWIWQEPILKTHTFKTYLLHELVASMDDQDGRRSYYIIKGIIQHGIYDTLVKGEATKFNYFDNEPEYFCIPLQLVSQGETHSETMENAKALLEEKANELLFSPMELLRMSLM